MDYQSTCNNTYISCISSPGVTRNPIPNSTLAGARINLNPAPARDSETGNTGRLRPTPPRLNAAQTPQSIDPRIMPHLGLRHASSSAFAPHSWRQMFHCRLQTHPPPRAPFPHPHSHHLQSQKLLSESLSASDNAIQFPLRRPTYASATSLAVRLARNTPLVFRAGAISTST
jgi:hypothetical protein